MPKASKILLIAGARLNSRAHPGLPIAAWARRGFRTSSISGSRRRKRRVRRSLSSRILIQLPRGLTLFVSVEIIHALVPLTKRFHRDRGSPRRGLDSGGPAVVGPPRAH